MIPISLLAAAIEPVGVRRLTKSFIGAMEQLRAAGNEFDPEDLSAIILILAEDKSLEVSTIARDAVKWVRDCATRGPER